MSVPDVCSLADLTYYSSDLISVLVFTLFVVLAGFVPEKLRNAENIAVPEALRVHASAKQSTVIKA